jgi:hypothetical protein
MSSRVITIWLASSVTLRYGWDGTNFPLTSTISITYTGERYLCIFERVCDEDD